MKRKALGTFLIFFGVFLVLSAVGLTVYNFWDNSRAESAAQSVLQDLFVSVPKPADSEFSGTIPPDRPTESETIPPHVLNTDLEMPEILVNGVVYIGILEIPALELELPIASRWNPNTAKNAPCRYSGSVYSGDMVVAGHNYRKHFGKLPSLPMGTLVQFTDTEGNAFLYEITDIETVESTDIETMCTGDWDLTLFTCTAGGQARFAIRCTAADAP